MMPEAVQGEDPAPPILSLSHKGFQEMRQALFDATGLKCPLPVLYARKRLQDLKPGEQLLILATDPGAPRDFQNFCQTTGHRLLLLEEKAGVFHILLEKVGP